MRDPKRIRKFCNELADIWETNCPDWRFGQLLVNVIDRDPFFLEEEDMMNIRKRKSVRQYESKT